MISRRCDAELDEFCSVTESGRVGTAHTNRHRFSFLSRLIVLLSTSFLVACQLLGPGGAQRSDIGGRLVSWAATAKPGDHIALKDLTDFTWDRVLVGGPYAVNSEVEEQLGFAWDVTQLPSYTREGLNFLAFAAGDHVVAWSVVSQLADFHMPRGEDPSVYPNDADVFVWNGHELVWAAN